MELTGPEIANIILRIFLACICLYFIFTRLSRFLNRTRGQTFFKLLITFTVWGSILAFTVAPSLASNLSQNLGLGENLNTLTFIGFVITFAVIFRLLRIIESLESEISDIVSKLATQNVVLTKPEGNGQRQEKQRGTR